MSNDESAAEKLAKHEQQLQQVTRDIAIIYKAIDGVPQRIDAIDKSINCLTKTLNDFISELRKECPTKDYCKLTHQQLESQHEGDMSTLTTRVDNLEQENTHMKWGIITGLWGIVTGLAIVIYDFLKDAISHG